MDKDVEMEEEDMADEEAMVVVVSVLIKTNQVKNKCIIHPFHDSYKPIDRISIINGALAYDTETGKIYIY